MSAHEAEQIAFLATQIARPNEIWTDRDVRRRLCKQACILLEDAAEVSAEHEAEKQAAFEREHAKPTTGA